MDASGDGVATLGAIGARPRRTRSCAAAARHGKSMRRLSLWTLGHKARGVASKPSIPHRHRKRKAEKSMSKSIVFILVALVVVAVMFGAVGPTWPFEVVFGLGGGLFDLMVGIGGGLFGLLVGGIATVVGLVLAFLAVLLAVPLALIATVVALLVAVAAVVLSLGAVLLPVLLPLALLFGLIVWLARRPAPRAALPVPRSA